MPHRDAGASLEGGPAVVIATNGVGCFWQVKVSLVAVAAGSLIAMEVAPPPAAAVTTHKWAK